MSKTKNLRMGIIIGFWLVRRGQFSVVKAFPLDSLYHLTHV